MSERTCLCGTRLARDNHGSECSLCARLRLIARSGDPKLLVVRLGRRLAELYSGYREAESRESYLAELTALLDGLCELFGVALPRFETVAKPVRVKEVV